MALASCSQTGSIGVKYDDADLDIDTPWVEYSVPVTKVTFDEGQESIELNRGDEFTYSFSIEPKKATKGSLTWESSNEDVATVEKGVVTAVDAGEATITVSNEENSFAPINLNVKVNVPLQRIHFERPSIDVDYEHSYQLQILYEPSDTTQKGVTWSSNNEDIATVDEDGLVTTKSLQGAVTITAASAYINEVASIVLNVDDRTVYPDSVVIDESQEKVEIGHDFKLVAHAESSSGNPVTHPEMTYYSTNSEILSVDEDTGVVHALKEGSAQVYAKASNGIESSKVTVTVFEVKVQEIVMQDQVLSNRNGRSDVMVEYSYITDTEGYTLASTPHFSYSIADTSIATVNDNGKLFAVASEGTTKITVSEARGGASKTVNLIVKYEVDSMTLTGQGVIEVNQTTRLNVTTQPSGVPQEFFSFSSSDNQIATVNEFGDVTGVSSGQVTITATAFGVKAEHVITVKDPAPQHVYYAKGIGGDWSVQEQYALKADMSDSNHYYLGPVHLIANTKIKVHDVVNDIWYGSNEGYTEQGAYWKAVEGGDLMVLIEGDFYIDLYIEHNEGNHLKLYYQGSQDDPIYGFKYYALGIGGDWSPVEQYGLKSDPTDANHFYLGPLSLVQNTEIKVLDVETNTWYGSNEGYTEQEEYWTTVGGGNVKVIVGGDYYVDLYVQHDQGNHVKLHYEGGDAPIPPEPEDNNYYLKGAFNNWTISEDYLFTVDAEDTNIYTLEGVEIHAGQAMKGYKTKDHWYGVSQAYDGCGWTVGDNGNCVVSNDGVYTVTLYVNSDYGNHLAITKTGDLEPVDPPIYEHRYYAEGIGGVWEINEDYGLEVDSEDANHYHVGPFNLAAETEIKIYDVETSSFIGSNEGYTEQEGAWITVSGGNVKTLLEGEYYIDLYIEHDQGNHLKLYYTGEIPTPTVEYYLKFKSAEWAQDDNYKFVADAEDTNKYILANVDLTAEDEIKAQNPALGDNGWYGVANTYDNCHYSVGDNGNCIISESGNYDVYLFINSDDGNHLQLIKHEPFDINKTTVITVTDETGKNFTYQGCDVKLHLFNIQFADNSPITSIQGLIDNEVSFGEDVAYNAESGIIDVRMTWVQNDPTTYTVTIPAYIKSCDVCVFNTNNAWVHKVDMVAEGYPIEGDAFKFSANPNNTYALYLYNNENPKYDAWFNDKGDFNTPLNLIVTAK